MGNNTVKTIIIVMVLVVLSFIVGAQISDSMKGSAGAFALVAGVAVMFFLLLMGNSSWKLCFILPVFLPFMPFRIEFVPPLFAFTFCIGCYWLVMWGLRQSRFEWHSLPILDIQVALVFLYMLVSFYRHPVAVKALGLDYDFVGGREYFYCLFATSHYIILSSLPIRLEELLSLLKKMFFIGIGLGFYYAFKGMLRPGSGMDFVEDAEHADAGDVLANGRFSYFAGVGANLLLYAYSRWPLTQLFRSVSRCGMLLFGSLAVLVSGWRTNLAILIVKLTFISFVKRELAALIFIGLFFYMGLLALSTGGVFYDAPFGMQRVLSILPGMQISEKAKEDANSSSEIRVRMWKNALNPRTGLIKDYVWGDGYQSSLSMMRRDQTAEMRGVRHDIQAKLQQQGLWHNGYVTFIHRLGFIGLIVFQVLMLSFVLINFQTAQALRKIENGVFGILPCLSLVGVSLTVSFLVLGPVDVFLGYHAMVLSKIQYCALSKRGLIPPLFVRYTYVPMIIREQQDQGSQRA